MKRNLPRAERYSRTAGHQSSQQHMKKNCSCFFAGPGAAKHVHNKPVRHCTTPISILNLRSCLVWRLVYRSRQPRHHCTNQARSVCCGTSPRRPLSPGCTRPRSSRCSPPRRCRRLVHRNSHWRTRGQAARRKVPSKRSGSTTSF